MNGADAGKVGFRAFRLRRRAVANGSGAKPLSMRARLTPLIGDQRRAMVAMSFLAIFAAFAEVVNLILITQIAATLVKPNATHARPALLHIHASTGTLILLAFIISVARVPLLQLPGTILAARIVATVGARVRTSLYQAFSHASWELQSRDREGQLQEIMTNQTAQAVGSVGSIMGLINSTLTFVVMLASAFALNVYAALIVLGLGIATFGLMRPLRGMGGRRSRALSRAQVQYARGIAESIRVAEETQVFGAGEAQRRRIDGLVAISRRLLFQTQLLTRIGSTISESVVYLLLVGGLFLIHSEGDRHIASLGAVVLIVVRASSSGEGLQSAYQGLIQAMPYVERVQEAEARYRDSMPVQGSVALARVETLAFENVGYAYRPGRPVLSDVSFEVKGEEVIGVIGPSGAGKSTLVQLLLRLRAPVEGSYLVNGTSAQEIAQADWYRHVAYVPQEPQLLHASVAENIRFFRDLDDEAVERAGRLARIHEDIMSWTDGYDTIVGPRADAVSGGQQQRICLARALVGRPEVLVLDEPTSALDPTSEALIQESLTGLKKQLTMFIIAHRMSTLNICDRVMIIIDGKLTAFDTINYLQQHNSYYRTASQHAQGNTLPELGAFPDASAASLS